jgi:hypothetical protein
LFLQVLGEKRRGSARTVILPNGVYRIYIRGYIDYQVAQPQTFRNAVGISESIPLESVAPELAAQRVEELLKEHTDRRSPSRDPYVVDGVNVPSPRLETSTQPFPGQEL